MSQLAMFSRIAQIFGDMIEDGELSEHPESQPSFLQRFTHSQIFMVIKLNFTLLTLFKCDGVQYLMPNVQSARGSGRSWKCTTLLVWPLLPSICAAERVE
jgi:hypothetical protein